MEIYDIVSGYPINTKIVASNIIGEDIGKIELQNTSNKIK